MLVVTCSSGQLVDSLAPTCLGLTIIDVRSSFHGDGQVVSNLTCGVYREPGMVGSGAAFLARLLQYMETPQYLRRYASVQVER